MKNYIFLLIVLMISCNTDEIYIDVYDPVQEEIDSLNQRKTDLALIFSYLETEDINYTDSTSSGVYYSVIDYGDCLLYTSPSPRDATLGRMPSCA